jgi:hypothetical protein
MLGYLIIAVVGAGCTVVGESTVSDASAPPLPESGTTDDGSSTPEADAGMPDADGSPSSDDADALVSIDGEGGGADADFQIKSAVGTNLASLSDVRPTCATVAGFTAGTYVMTCTEANGPEQPCRTVTVVFSGQPSSGRVYAAVAKTSPADGEAVVAYQEASDCTPSTTNGWAEAQSSGDFTVDVFGDTGFDFTLHDVPLTPAPVASGITNQGAMGAFTLAGTGLSSFPF